MADAKDMEQRLHLITRRLPEVLGVDLIEAFFAEGKNPKCFWATAPTGKPHIGYFIPLTKFADFLQAGVEVTVLLLDTYAFLVNYKFPWEQVLERTKYYRFLVTAVLDAIGVPTSKVRFVEESAHEASREFMIDHYRLCVALTQQDVRDTGKEVSGTNMFSPMLTPGLQSLAEEYMGMDIQFGGTDQRGIFNMAERFLPRLGYRRRAHLMNEMLGSLVGGKMSSSDPAHTKIMFLDDPDTVRAKISGASCEAGNVDTNGILPTLKEVLIPISELRVERFRDQAAGQNPPNNATSTADRRPFCSGDAPGGAVFTVELDQGKRRHYQSYDEIERDFVENRLDPGKLKAAVAEAFNQLLAPIRKAYDENNEWQAVDKVAYPDENDLCYQN